VALISAPRASPLASRCNAARVGEWAYACSPTRVRYGVQSALADSQFTWFRKREFVVPVTDTMLTVP
jgi:hypothetical protein